MDEQNREKLIELFRAVLDLDSDEAATAAHQDSEERWDSLNHVRLILAIESEFGIEVELVESMAQTSFESTCALLTAKGIPVAQGEPST
ncbi:MAG: acyl carrier protein [Longimicrobiales bacterium]